MIFLSIGRVSPIALRQFIAISLIAIMLLATAPATLAATAVKDAAEKFVAVTNSAGVTLQQTIFRQKASQGTVGTQRGKMPTRQIVPGVKPRVPRTKEQHGIQVASLEINPGSTVVLQAQQSMLFSAVPLDSGGAPIQGLTADWESSDKRIVKVRKSGEALAGQPGSAVVTAKAGGVRQRIEVTVIETADPAGGKKKEDTKRRDLRGTKSGVVPPVTGTTRSGRAKRSHGASTPNPISGLANAPAPQNPPTFDPLPDGETNSLYQAANVIGAAPGKKRAGALTPPVATGGDENGNSNFSFAFPVAGMSGRGLDVSLSLTYNSQLWNKSDDGTDTYLTYNVDSGWPAPGFRLGFGQIEDQGSYGFTLTEPDGTRRALIYVSSNNYETTDGSFLHYTLGSGWSTLYYPNGTTVSYGAAGSGYRSYPIQIEDRNGNYFTISYVAGVGPKINTIEDTLERYVRFYYGSSGDLLAITAPGLTGNDDLQMMRFYYASSDINLNASGLFGSGVIPSLPPGNTAHVLQYVYLPSSADGSGAHVGYKFEYSAYGMIYRTTQFRGMTASSTSLTSAGSVTEGTNTVAATTTYDYPGTSVNSSTGLTDVPKYATRTDDWAGRTTSSAPSYTFANSTATDVKISTVTAPDGTITETQSNDLPGEWNDGLIIKTKVGYGSGPTWLKEITLDWEQDSGSSNARVYQIRTKTAGLTKATVLSFTTYNNISAVSERDFSTDGTVASELRRTETTYITSSNYLNRHLVHLPSVIKVFPGGSTTAAAEVDYAYDNYGSAHADLTPRSDIVRHDVTFNPFSLSEDKCEYDCTHWHNDICTHYDWICPYIAATDYRGNVTSVTTYTDAATPSGAITHSTKYDVAGNVTAADVDCCQQKTISYTDSPNTHTYAYPVSETSGNPSGTHLTTSTTYDFNTGLVATTTDENSQVTTDYYNADSLRLNYIADPDGGQINFYYGDGLLADAAGHYHYWNMTTTKFGSGTHDWTDNYNFLDGRGAPAQVFYDGTWSGPWTTKVIEYDQLGRAYRVTSPFSDGGYGGSLSGLWSTATFDHLGRVTNLSMPSGDDGAATTASVSSTYDDTDTSTGHLGILVTVSDQSSKMRRQKVNALGLLVRLDEPTTSGLGSTSSPNQPTNYDYDALGNLVEIQQGAQTRYFKYDSLSRLIHDKQPEQDTAYTTSYSSGNNSWSRKISYNSSGLVTEGDDARGIKTLMTYDDLNRITQVEYRKVSDNSLEGTPTAHYYYDSQSLPSGAPSTSSPDSYARGYSTGRLVARTYGSGATGDYFGYDQMGQVSQQFQLTGSAPTKYKLSYAYNLAGMLTTETYPTGRIVYYAYGYGARLSKVADITNYPSNPDHSSNVVLADSFSYAANGGLTSETWGNTAVHAMSYNHANQVNQVKLTLGSTVLQQYDYSYGEFNTSTGAVVTTANNGQIGRIQATINGTPQWNQGFSYDELGRLSNVVEHESNTMTTQRYSQSYDYDRYGNKRQSANTTLGLPAISSSDYDTANNNRYVSTVASYDAGGNITTDLKFHSPNLTYAYDANNRQKSASNGSWTETQTYNSTGQRVQTSLAAGSTTYRTLVYDVFGQDVAEYSGSTGATLERENIYRGELLAVVEAGVFSYILHNSQSSASAVMNNNGSSSSIIARHDYLPFGEELSPGTVVRTTAQGYGVTDTNRQRYAGTERDDSSGLDHTLWRKYESRSGRWTSPDPYGGSMTLADPQNLNRYSYVLNDPVNLVDPSGLFLGPGCIWAGMFPTGPGNSVVTITDSFLSEIFTSSLMGGGGGVTMHAPLADVDGENSSGGGVSGGGGTVKFAHAQGNLTREACEALAKEIDRLAQKVSERADELRNDILNFTGRGMTKDIDGHIKSFKQAQVPLNEALNKYDKYCGGKGPPPPAVVPGLERARKMAEQPVPRRERPVAKPSQSSVLPWIVPPIVIGIACIVCPECCAAAVPVLAIP